MIYLQDDGKKNNEQTVDQVNSKPYRLQVADIININIKAIDPELVKIFNASDSDLHLLMKCQITTMLML